VARIIAEEAALRPGLFVDDLLLARLLDRDVKQEALDRALHFLEGRPRSEREVRTRLAQKGVSPELVDQVVERLRSTGLIDDAAFAQFWIENRERFSPRGARALKAELRQKGLASEVIDENLDDAVDEEAGAREVALRQARKLANLDRQTFRQKMYVHLARRGFDSDAIIAAIDEAWRQVAPEPSPEDED
jgi:regulatory protein